MKEFNKFDYILTTMITLILFGVIGGALAPARVIAIVLIPLLLKKSKHCKYLRPFFVFFVFFFCFCLISMLWTPDPVQGGKELIYHPLHFIYFFEILAFSKYANNPVKSLSWGWIITVFLCSFVALWEITTDKHLSMAMQESYELKNVGGGVLVQHLSASVTFNNPNSYVTHLCYCFPWIVYLYILGEKGLVKRGVLFFSVIMTLVVIFFNMSRGGLMSIAIMGFAYFLFSKKTMKKILGAAVIVLLMVYVIVNYGQDAMLLMDARASEGGLTHDDARYSIWTVALKVLSDYWYVGSGVGSVTAALSGASKAIIASPHSLFFEVLIQYGVFFTAIVLIFILRIFKDAWRLKERNKKTVLMMSLLTMPAYTIIDSGYLLGVNLFALIGTMYVFIHVDEMKREINAFAVEQVKK